MVYSITPSVFGWSRQSLETTVHLWTGRWGACVVPRERAVDIDHELDFRVVQMLMEQRG